MRRIPEHERAFAILAYPLFTTKELSEFNGKSKIWWTSISQRYNLKKANPHPHKKDEGNVILAILAYPYYSNVYLMDVIGCSKNWLEKLAQKYNLKKAGTFYVGKLDDCQEENLVGLPFGDLVVIDKCPNKNKSNILWLCECKCGNKLKVASMLLRNGKVDKCKICKYELQNQEKSKSKNGQARNTWWNKFFNDAFIRGKNVSITQEYIENLFEKQNGKCALSGIDLELPKIISHKKYGNASLDRIDSKIDYEEENVQWLHKDINMMKQQFDEEYFIKLCCAVADHYRNKLKDNKYDI